MIRLLIVITFCFFGCANTVTYYPQCNFPDSILKQGGLLKKNFDPKENKKSIFVKNISCYEGKIKKLDSPIPFFLKREEYLFRKKQQIYWLKDVEETGKT